MLQPILIHAVHPYFPYEAHRSGVWRVGYLNTAGDWALQPQFAAARVFTDGVAAVKVADAWGYIDLTGAWRIEPQYFTAGYVSAGKAEGGELDHGRLTWKVVSIPVPDRAETEQ